MKDLRRRVLPLSWRFTIYKLQEKTLNPTGTWHFIAVGDAAKSRTCMLYTRLTGFWLYGNVASISASQWLCTIKKTHVVLATSVAVRFVLTTRKHALKALYWHYRRSRWEDCCCESDIKQLIVSNVSGIIADVGPLLQGPNSQSEP